MSNADKISDFLASSQDEHLSPFITEDSRGWGENLSLKASLLAACFLGIAFTLSFFSKDVSNLFLLGVYFLVGTQSLIDSIHTLAKFEINIDILMTLAALLSVFIGSGLEGGLLLVLFEVSGAMEELVTKKTRNAVASLHKVSPKTCFVLKEGALLERSIHEIQADDTILVKAGEIIPLDGIIIDGASSVNMAHLTGESEPLVKKVKDDVTAGSRNLEGTLTIRVNRTSSDSTLARIIKLITEAQENKPTIQRFLDRFGKWYATTVILLSTFFALALPFILSIPFLGIEGSVYRALAFLIAASPCALIIATPTAYLSAISSCASKGILLKGGISLDALASTQIVAFDKTGTLTLGKLFCNRVYQIAGDSLDLDRAIATAATLERHAVHPIAEAITKMAQEKGLSNLSLSDFKSVAGSGLSGVVEKQPAFIGHKAFIESYCKELLQIETPQVLTTYLFVQGALFAFEFTDKIRSESASVIGELKEEDLEIVMLSGDHIANARAVAASIGIANVYADLRPEDKLKKVQDLSSSKNLVMIGDGINDAPALARATVGISMGKVGSDTAIEASDIIFLNDDLSQLPWLYKKAHLTLRIIKQNISLALGVILFTTTPALIGLVPLWMAVILHEGGTVLVGLNSLRLLRR